MRPLHLARAASHRAAAANRTPAASPPDLAALRTAVRRGAGPLYDRVLADGGPDTARLFDEQALTDLASSLGHPFRGTWLLRAALLHRSFDAEKYRTRSSELLAWIGDSVMYQTTTAHLLARFPDAAFGDLAKARIALISRAACDQAARRLGIHTLLRTGASFASAESAKDGVTPAILFVRPSTLTPPLPFTPGKSFDAETYRTRCGELLAWVGDSVMYQTATAQLLARFKSASIGQLANARTALISRAYCDTNGRKLGIDKLIITGASFASSDSGRGGVTQSMVAEAFESVIGAVALDAGHNAAAAAYWRVVGGLPDSIEEVVAGAAGRPTAFD